MERLHLWKRTMTTWLPPFPCFTVWAPTSRHQVISTAPVSNLLPPCVSHYLKNMCVSGNVRKWGEHLEMLMCSVHKWYIRTHLTTAVDARTERSCLTFKSITEWTRPHFIFSFSLFECEVCCSHFVGDLLHGFVCHRNNQDRSQRGPSVWSKEWWLDWSD